MTITHDLNALKTGFEDGVLAAKEETTVGAIFRGCAGSLSHRLGGTGYEKNEYSVAFRGGYMHHIENLKIWTKDGVVKKVIAEG